MLSLYSASRSRWFGRDDRRGWSMVEIGEMPRGYDARCSGSFE
jgi:hypothetical protein